MKKLLIGVLATIGISSAHAEMGSVEKYLSENHNWQGDPSSLVYVNTRCTAINHAISKRYEGLEDKDSINKQTQFYDTAEYFATASFFFGSMAGVSDDALKDRAVFWGKYYQSEIYDNWIKYNNSFYGQVGNDLVSCNKKVYGEVTNIVEYLKAAQKETSL